MQKGTVLAIAQSHGALAGLAVGTRLVVLASDPMAKVDIPLYCRQHGHDCTDPTHHVHDAGAYVQAVVQPVQALKIIPALRVDRVSGSFTDGLTQATSPVHDYGTITQPKISVAYAVRPDTSVYANWGRTFQILTGSRAPAYITSAT